MDQLLALAGINITVTVAFAVLRWRQNTVLEQRLGQPVDNLAATVANVDRRLARLEGWLDRDWQLQPPDPEQARATG